MLRRLAIASVAALSFVAAYSVQAAENHNSSRSNRGQQGMPAGNTGAGKPGAPAEASKKGCNIGDKCDDPKKVGVKEEGVKKK